MPEENRRSRWPVDGWHRVWHALVLVVALMMAFPLGFALVAPALGVAPDAVFGGSAAASLAVVVMGTYQIGLVGGVGVVWFGRTSLRELGWTLEQPARDVAAGLGVGILLLAVTLASVPLMGVGVGEVLESMGSFTAGQRVQMVFIGAVAALAEETLFRGYLQPPLVAKLGRWGIVVQAAIFALYHVALTPHLLSLAVKGVYGLALGTLRGKEGSLVGPAVAHFFIWQTLGFA